MKATVVLICLISMLVWGGERIDSIYNMPDTSWLMLSDYWPTNLLSSTAYSGMVYNHHDHTILQFGGGHAATGNPVLLGFSFETMTWDSLNHSVPCSHYDSTWCVFDANGNKTGGILDADSNPRPASRHSYDGLVVPQDTNLLLICNAPFSQGAGGNDCTNWRSEHGKDNYWFGDAMWMFDFETQNWNHTHADNRAWEPSAGHSMALMAYSGSAEDPVTGLIYGVCGRRGTLVARDYKNDTTWVVASSGGPGGGVHSLSYRKASHSLLYFASSTIYEYLLNEGRWVDRRPGGSHFNSTEMKVVQDTLNDIFCCFNDNTFHYYSYAHNRWYSIAYGSQFPGRATAFCSIYEPVNNVIIIVRGVGWSVRQTWAYKVSNTPGTLQGTTTAAERIAGVPGSGTSLSVKPNPFNPTTTITLVTGVTAIHESPPRSAPIVRLYDVTGKLVSDLSANLRHFEFGIRHFTWDASSLASGIYILQAKIGKKILKKTLVLSK